MDQDVESPGTTVPDSAGGASLRPLSEAELTDEVIWGLVDAAPDGLVMVDESGRILLVNRQAEDIFGYDRGELLGLPVETLVPPALRGVHTAHRTRYRADPKVRNMGAGLDLKGYRKDGAEFPVEISLSPLRTDGQLRVIAAVRDVTERAEAEARARQVQQVLDATPDAVFIFDPDSLRISYANRGACAHLGYSREELVAMTPLAFKPELSEQQYRDMVASLRTTSGSSITYTTPHRRKDGTDVPVEAILQSAMPDDEGRPQFMVSLARDITERLESEEQLRVAQAELQTVDERERIARDLHDTVIQRLFAAGLTLQGTVSRIQEAEAARRIEDVVDQLDDTIRELRAAIFGLEARGSGAGLREQLLGIVSEERPGLGFDPRIVIEGSLEAIGDEVAAAVLATLREALSNVARHARATGVEVRVTTGPEFVLEVVDDGRGLAQKGTGGHGLANMASRAEALGGTLQLSPGTPSGTLLRWAVPLQAGAR